MNARPRHGSAERAGRGGLEALFGRGAKAVRRRFGVGAFAAVVVLVTVGSLLSWRQYDDGKSRALNEMRTRVVLASTVLDTYFAGQLAVLRSIAAAPAVVRTDVPAMATYFAKIQKSSKPPPFTGGLGWIDRGGVLRVSDTRPRGARVDLSDRSYVKVAISTGRAFISEGLTTRVDNRRVVVMAVPTRDRRGRITGVLTGLLKLRISATNRRAIDLGYVGLAIIDRAGQQLTLASFARPANRDLLGRIRRGEGVLKDTRGLDGSPDRAVAFANSKAPGWITVIDRPRSDVFASARRALILELASIAAAALVVLTIVGWAIVRSRRDMEAGQAQVRQWDELSQSLGQASAAAEVSAALGAALRQSLSNASSIVAVRADDGGVAPRIWTFAPLDTARVDEHDPRVTRLASLAMEAETPLRLATPESVAAALGESAVVPEAWAGSVYGIPLIVGGEAIGSVTLLLPRGHTLDAATEALVAANADQAARALARARRHEREHGVAVELQRSLLPAELPFVEGLDMAGRYTAGGVGLEVGGDWYDAVRRPDGIVHFTVGDVAGRGIPAAVLMGQLRNVFRALAYEHTSPAEIARRLTRHVPDAGMATAVFLALDPLTGELRYASAGHPPTVLVDAVSGETTLLDQAASPPLGWADPATITDARLTVPSQVTLLMYTDGLVERRGRNIDEGIARVTELLAERPELAADEASDRLIEEIIAPLAATDDVAVLLVRVSGVPSVVKIEIPSDPSTLRELRARLRTWLTRRGVDKAQLTDTIIAVSEACNNAMEHAYVDRDGPIRLTLEHGARALRISVEDEGAWRAPSHDPTRGRGMMIMEGTMNTVNVRRSESGTRVELELELASGRPV